MKIIVTGSDGFIGKRLVRTLTEMGHTVIGCDRKSLQEVDSVKAVLEKDINQFGEVGAIIHLAAQTSVFNTDVTALAKDNILSFMNIVEVANALNCRLVYASSSCAANVTSMYGLTKMFDEQYASIYASNAVGVRFHNVYGPSQREGMLLQVCLECSANHKPITLYNNGKNKRHFTYIDDIVRGIIWLLRHQITGVVNICNPEETSVLEFVEEFKKHRHLEYVLTDDLRQYDKEVQLVQSSLPEPHITYTQVAAGLYKALISQE